MRSTARPVMGRSSFGRLYLGTAFRGAADWHTDPRTPRGCLMVVGALACGAESLAIWKEMNARRAADEARIRQHLEQAQESGDLPSAANPADLARYVITVIRGMVVQAVGGASRDDLEGVITTALRAWLNGARTKRHASFKTRETKRMPR